MEIYINGEKKFEIDGQELKALITSIQGNLSSNYLTKDTIANMIANARSLYQVAELPATPSNNTMYYVGTTQPYHVYLYDSAGQQIDMGESELELSNYYTKEEADNKFIMKQNFLNTFYPKGSTYITYENINPSTFLGGTWELIGGSDANLNYYPAFAIDGDVAGATIAESLPNINAQWTSYDYSNTSTSGAVSRQQMNPGAIAQGSEIPWYKFAFNAHNSNTTYKDNAHVNVNAIKLFYWRRTDDTQTAYQLTPLNILNEMPANPTNDTVLGTKATKDYIDAGSKVTMKNITCTKTSLISNEFYFGGNFIDLGSGTGIAIVRGGFRPETAVANGSGICYCKVGDKNLLGLDNAIGYVMANNNAKYARFCQSEVNGNQIKSRDLTIETNTFYWLNIAYPAKIAS